MKSNAKRVVKGKIDSTPYVLMQISLVIRPVSEVQGYTLRKKISHGTGMRLFRAEWTNNSQAYNFIIAFIVQQSRGANLWETMCRGIHQVVK